MNKKCGKCLKTVYPTEELKCLDKVWHKACFRCQSCNMSLTMKNYKGYDKFPYCNAHYPTTKHTAVADTPESRRIAQNTKIQSNIKYHEQFEKDKGAKISVADDPETERLKKNMQVVSNVAYHNTLKQKFEQDANRPMEMTDNLAARNRKKPGSISEYNPVVVEASPAAARGQPTHVYNSKGEDEAVMYDDHQYNQPSRRQIGSIADYDPVPQTYQPPPQQQQQPQQTRSSALFSPTPYSPPGQFSSKQRQIGSVPGPYSNQGYQYGGQPQNQPGSAPVGMYTPFRPQEEGSRPVSSAKQDNNNFEKDDNLAESIQILDDLEKSLSGNGFDSPEPKSPLHEPSDPPKDLQSPGQFMTTYPVEGYDVQGSRSSYTNDYPAAPAQDVQGSRSSYTNDYPAPQHQEEPAFDDGFQSTYPSQPAPSSPPPEPEPEVGNGFRTTYPTEEQAPQQQKQNRGVVSRALYDYQAQDTDEVTFMEHDIIFNCEPVDDGWMFGTVENSGLRGMLPSNYVERIN